MTPKKFPQGPGEEDWATLQVDLTEAEIEFLVRTANAQGISVNRLINDILEEELKNLEESPEKDHVCELHRILDDTCFICGRDLTEESPEEDS